MKLESIVPPLELCQRIPAGKFADSVLVWCAKGIGITLRSHVTAMIGCCPAPTLAEIMEDLREGQLFPGIKYDAQYTQTWCVKHAGLFCHYRYDHNPTTAALKMWFDLNAIDWDNFGEEGEEEGDENND